MGQTVNLGVNLLTSLPAEVGRLANLTRLDLSGNRLTSLPAEVGRLTRLTTLFLDNNPDLIDPPPEIAAQGTAAVLAYLAAKLEEGGREEWVSKLLVVGQGGVGKTALLRALRGEPFIEGDAATKGIDIGALELPYPSRDGVAMQLTTWDFAGQEINHATHQFFLTNRSLFLLAWNSRQGYGQGRIEYWLDTIHARAPESPVLIVATHNDLWPPDIPLDDLRQKYPRIIGQCAISSKSGDGIPKLRATIAAVAAGLPLMGERWPSRWLDAANALRGLADRENCITATRLRAAIAEHGVTGSAAGTLARWLHELGDLLYFQENESLRDLVLLRPRWVTEAISRVLSDEGVKRNIGIFTRDDMERLWADIEPSLREHLLNLMEEFDLSYRTRENREISLVVELLQLDPPDYRTPWEAIARRPDCKEISMKFDLAPSNLPAGVPTWFIARQHRFTTHTHWRHGALFADGPAREHLGLLRAYTQERYLHLAVRGPFPQTFFTLLQDGLETTLKRFPGLPIVRKVPCAGRHEQPCEHEFVLDHLQRAITKTPPVLEIRCPVAFEQVSIAQLLFGIPWRFRDDQEDRLKRLETVIAEDHVEVLAGIADLRSLGAKTLVELREQRALIEREFTRLFRRDQRFEESHCPNVFTLRPSETSTWRAKLVGQPFALQLYCQAPGHWHPVGKPYKVSQSAQWLRTLAPHVRRLTQALQYAAPLLAPGIGYVAPDIAKVIKDDLELMKALVEKLPKIEDDPDLERADPATRAEGASLRGLRSLLDGLDKTHQWGGLRKMLTPEDDYLWLCSDHATEYDR
jgi:internalin A